MKKNNQALVIVIVILLLVGGYFLFKNVNKTEITVPITGIQDSVHYSCTDGSIDAVFGSSAVSLSLSDGRNLVLIQTPADVGARYEQDNIVFISEGESSLLQERNIITYQNCTVEKGNAVAGESVFVDQSKTLSFSYPKEYVFTDESGTSTSTWRANTQTLGTLIAKVTIPKDSQRQTNFSEATFTIGTSKDTNAVKNCLMATNGEYASGKVEWGGSSYSVFSISDAGAGNFYDTTSYRTVLGNQCYALEYTIHSTNIGAYDPSQNIVAFDKAKVTAVLEGIARSFYFIGASTVSQNTVTPLTLVEDSRCPQGVECVWAGTVKITIKVVNKNGEVGTSEIFLGETKNIAGVFVTFTNVSPVKTEKNLVFSDYKFDFTVK